MNTEQIELPWPPSALSPNARVHWAKKARAAKDYRSDAYICCKQAGVKLPETFGKLHLWLDFYPPDRRSRDIDNLQASGKSMIDGIAEYYRINDVRFVCHSLLMEEIIAGGLVKVRITSAPPFDFAHDKLSTSTVAES